MNKYYFTPSYLRIFTILISLIFFNLNLFSQTINISTSSLSALSTCESTASSSRTFTVDGSDLTANIVVNVDNNTYVEISTSSGSGYSNSINLTQVGGDVSSTLIYVRLKSVGSLSSDVTNIDSEISCTSSGATTKRVTFDNSFIDNNPATANNTTNSSAICEGSTKSLTTSSSGGSWSENGSGSISGTDYLAGSIVSDENVTVTYTINSTNSLCTASTADVTFAVDNSATANNSTNSSAICEGSTKSLITSSSGGSWSENGTGIISGTDYSTGSISGNENVTVTYTLNSTNSVCTASTADVTFTVNNGVASANNSTNNSAICEGSTKSLTTSSSGGSWSENGNGTISGTDYLTGNISADENVTVTYTISNGACSSTADVTFTVNNGVANAVNTTNTSAICETSTKSLTTSSSGGNWSHNGSGSISSDTYSTGNIGSNENVTVTYTIQNGACTSSANQTFTVNALPSANAGSDVAHCTGLSSSLSASGGVSYSWSPSTGLSATNVSNPTASHTSTTTYTLTATDGNGCTDTDDIVVTVNANTSANAGSDVAHCTGLSSSLSASGGVSYSWSPSTGLSATNVSNPTASHTSTTTYTVTATDGNGFSNTDDVVVTVIAVPNAGSISGTNSMGIGGTAQLSSNGDSGGSWSSSNTLIAKVNSSSGLVTGEDAGSATITYTKTASPCSDATATYAVTVTTTNVSVQAGNWSSGSSWGTGSKPTGAQNIQISHNITVDETTADLGNLTIDNGATVTVGGFELEVSGTTDINGTLSMQALSTVDIDGNFDATGGAVTFTGAGTLELAGNVTSLGAFTSASGSKVHYNGGAQTIVAASAKNAAYEDLEFSGGPKTLEGNTTVSDDLIFSEDYDLITAGHILSIKKTPTGYSDSRLIRRSSSTADVTVKFINATSGSAAECIIPVGVDGDLREVGILPENTGTETYTVIYKNGSPYNGGVLNWGWGTSGTGSPINSAADAAHVNNVYYYEIDRDNSIDAKLKFLQFSGLIYTPSGSERHIMHWDGNEWDQLASSSSGNGVVTTNYIKYLSPSGKKQNHIFVIDQKHGV